MALSPSTPYKNHILFGLRSDIATIIQSTTILYREFSIPDLQWMSLRVENVLVERNEFRLGKDEVEILKRLGEEECLHLVRLHHLLSSDCDIRNARIPCLFNDKIGEKPRGGEEGGYLGLCDTLQCEKDVPGPLTVFLIACHSIEKKQTLQRF